MGGAVQIVSRGAAYPTPTSIASGVTQLRVFVLRKMPSAENMPGVKVRRLGAPLRTISAAPSEHHLALPSEQEVLDAMAEVPPQDLRDVVDMPPPSQRQAVYRSVVKLCRAELARRGLK